jgi:hypothetical protein
LFVEALNIYFFNVNVSLVYCKLRISSGFIISDKFQSILVSWEMRNAYKILFSKHKGRRPLWRARHEQEKNIKMVLEKKKKGIT